MHAARGYRVRTFKPISTWLCTFSDSRGVRREVCVYRICDLRSTGSCAGGTFTYYYYVLLFLWGGVHRVTRPTRCTRPVSTL